jgi:hypothetical protein
MRRKGRGRAVSGDDFLAISGKVMTSLAGTRSPARAREARRFRRRRRSRRWRRRRRPKTPSGDARVWSSYRYIYINITRCKEGLEMERPTARMPPRYIRLYISGKAQPGLARDLLSRRRRSPNAGIAADRPRLGASRQNSGTFEDAPPDRIEPPPWIAGPWKRVGDARKGPSLRGRDRRYEVC